MSVREASRIRLKQSVPEETRTESKDKMAWYIVREVVWAGRWPLTMTKIAEETDFTRQHVTNTLNEYFEEAETEWVREDVFEAYRTGYRDCMQNREKHPEGIGEGKGPE